MHQSEVCFREGECAEKATATAMPTAAAAGFLICLLLSCAFKAAVGSNRRILHEPFLPQDSAPRSQPLAPPEYPFSTSAANSTPFFPSYASPPPPPSPATFASFPANISSLTVPASSKRESTSYKLIAGAIAAVAAAVVIVSLAVYLRIRLRNRGATEGSCSKNSKVQRSDSTISTMFNRAPNSRGFPKLQRPSQTSSEFLYLGTLVSSHAVGGGIAFDGSSTSTTNDDNEFTTRKMNSPELRPLPPLVRQRNCRQISCRSPYLASSKHDDDDDDDDEEFYSPKGSQNDRESLVGAGSASRRAFTAVEIENYNGSISNSSSSSSSSVSGSGSGSPVRSATLSVSPANTLSSINSIPKSPDLIEIQTDLSLQRKIQPSPSRSLGLVLPHSAPPSPLCSSSPEKYSERSEGKESNASEQNVNFPVKISTVLHDLNDIPAPPPPPPALSLCSSPSPPTPVSFTLPPPVSIPRPPPPPPSPSPSPSPPPNRSNLGETSRTSTPPAKQAPVEPPALVTSLRPVSVESPLISPVELPSYYSDCVQKSNCKGSPDNENGSLNETVEHKDMTVPKPKLKPLHWDKVRASSDREMVWDQLKSSSFKLNEEMIETLFVVNAPKSNPKDITRWQVLPSPGQDNGDRVLDSKKAQNIAILLRALNVTVEEVCEGLTEGNSDILSAELLESLMKMAPSKEEERKLKEHKDDSPIKLGGAEKFLKTVLDIPFAFKRMESMLYISNFESEKEYLEKSFVTLEAACEELRSSRMFLKVLEAVLKTGNRMNVGTNRGDAHAFKLDTLLKLVDIKGADGTSLLHFVVQEIIRSEGIRLSTNGLNDNSLLDDAKSRKLGLQIVSSISSELSNVKKAAAMDAEVLSGEVCNLSKGIGSIRDVSKLNEASSSKFSDSMDTFLVKAEEDLIRIRAQESVALSLVKEITEYFHGDSAKEEAHPFRIFMVVRDFLKVLDRVCKEISSVNERTIISSAHKFPVPVHPTLQPVSGDFPLSTSDQATTASHV